jgi:transcriptional regulator with XRE-family HTH domain
MPTATFADLIASHARRHGWTLGELAGHAGLAASTVSRLRSGARRPNAAQVEALADALALGRDERAALRDAAALARAPREVLDRLDQAERDAVQEQARRTRLEEGWTALRQAQSWYDGWWLTLSRSFHHDGRVQRSLLRIEGERATLQVMEAARLHFTYTGTCEILGDKAFIRLAEDRGGAEYVQITLQTLFDLTEPTFLFGLVCGLSGKDLRHPVSYPAASRLLMLFAGREGGKRLEPFLGAYAEPALRPCWPEVLGSDRLLRQAFAVEDGGDLDAAMLALISNGIDRPDGVLRAAFGG